MLLRDRIRRDGPMSFRDVMHAALYDAQHGYYTNLRRFDDFLTSPEVHPAFGWLLARQAVDVWTALGEPRPLRVFEMGGGSGALAESFVAHVREHVPELEYTIAEPSPALRNTQQQRLRRPEFRWSDHADAHLVIANEVADALPVHRVVVHDGALHELKVGVDGTDALVWIESEHVPDDVAAYFQRLGVRPPEGAVAEVSTGLEQWVQQLSASLQRGLALVLDYGYTAGHLYGRMQGTLLTYYRHTVGSDPLVRLGEQDISAHVDFTTLARAAQSAGLEVAGVSSQRTLLRKLGIDALIDAARGELDRRRLNDLLDPHGLGRIGALFLTRGLPHYTPAALGGGADWPLPDSAPRLQDDPAFDDLWRDAFPDDANR